MMMMMMMIASEPRRRTLHETSDDLQLEAITTCLPHQAPTDIRAVMTVWGTAGREISRMTAPSIRTLI